MNAGPGSRERMLELLCDRALEGLDAHEDSELAQLIALHRGGLEDTGYELAAAAVTLSVRDPVREPMPPHVTARLYAAAGLAPPQMAAPAYAPPQHPHPGPTPSAPYTASNAPTVVSPYPPGTVMGVAPPPPPAMPQAQQPHPHPPAQPHPRLELQPQPGAQVVAFPYHGDPASVRSVRRSTGSDPMRWIGWLAAAACLALAIGGWWPKPPREVARAGALDVPRVEMPPPPPTTPAERREAMLREAKDAVRTAWAPGKDEAAKGAEGEVVWSTTAQRGYMTFRGLAANDPTKNQYQLWIFDEEQDKRFPVDGGVFDVGPNGEVVVEIDPKIKVAKPTLFAITVEKPGGVVVSKRERIVLTAELKG